MNCLWKYLLVPAISCAVTMPSQSFANCFNKGESIPYYTLGYRDGNDFIKVRKAGHVFEIHIDEIAQNRQFQYLLPSAKSKGIVPYVVKISMSSKHKEARDTKFVRLSRSSGLAKQLRAQPLPFATSIARYQRHHRDYSIEPEIRSKFHFRYIQGAKQIFTDDTEDKRQKFIFENVPDAPRARHLSAWVQRIFAPPANASVEKYTYLEAKLHDAGFNPCISFGIKATPNAERILVEIKKLDINETEILNRENWPIKIEYDIESR